jgi:hypothetical protein
MPANMTTAPRQVLLFSGHMLDAPGRAHPRFPASKVHLAKAAVYRLLDQLQAGPQDAAVCSAACGGDLIFDRLALRRGVPLHLYLAFDREAFQARSVDFAGQRWQQRFAAVCAQAASVHVLPAPPQAGSGRTDPFERTNLWMLDTARALGAERIEFICLWNGQGGDGPGGTQHMMQAVRQAGGHIQWLDTRQLW